MTRLSKQGLEEFVQDTYLDNTTRQISPADLRQGFANLKESLHFTTVQTLTGLTPSWETQTGEVAYLVLTGNSTIPAPTDLYNGQQLSITIEQGTTGNHSVTWNSVFKFVSSPTIPTGTGEYETFDFRVHAVGTGYEVVHNNIGGVSLINNVGGVRDIWTGTEAQYAALTPKSPTTLYFTI